MNEEFAIKLKFIMDESSIASIKQKVAAVSGEFSGTTTSKVVERSNTELSRLEKRYNELLAKMKQFQLGANLTFKPTDDQWAEFDKWEQEAINIQEQMERIKNSSGETAANVQNIVNDFSVHATQVKNTEFDWKKLAKSGKQMLFGLMGIRSAYMLIRQAMSAYLSQNEELKNQMNQLYYTLGSALEPILRWIVRLFATIVLYVDYILRAFGFAGLKMEGFAKGAGGASKSLGKAAKDAKEINKQLAGFDEINNLNKDDNSGLDGGGAGGGGIGTSVWDDSFIGRIKQKIAEITAIISTALLVIGAILVFTGANLPLGIGLMVVGAAGLAAVIKVNWNSMTESLANLLSVLLGIVAGACLVLGFFLTFVVGGTALPLGIGLLVVGAASLAAAVAVNWKSAENHVKKAIKTLLGVISGVMLVIGVILVISGSNIPLGIGLIIGAIGTFAAAVVDWDALGKKLVEVFTDVKEKAKKKFEEIKETIKEKLNQAKSFFPTLGLAASEVGQTIKSKLEEGFSTIKAKAKEAWENMKNAFSDAGTTFGSIASTIKSKLESSFSTLKSKAQTAWNNVSDIFKSNSSTSQNIISRIQGLFASIKAVIRPEVRLPNITGSMSNGNIYWTENGKQTFVAYAQGTNFVPNDQLALLHKGEAVVPAEFNGSQGSPFVGNEETNDLLRQFMNIVQNKDFKAIISQREVGEASVNYIHRQSRIMGESIV